MNNQLLNGPSDQPDQPIEELNSEESEDQNDLDVNKGIVKNIDELKELIETNHPDPAELDESSDEPNTVTP